MRKIFFGMLPVLFISSVNAAAATLRVPANYPTIGETESSFVISMSRLD